MADIAESAPFTDPTTAISHGKRHLLVRDYTMAVTALAQACQLLAEKYGDTADELGEPYLLYGRALLGLAREEAGVLGGGVPGSEEAEEDEDEDEEEADEEKLSNVDEKEEEEDDANEHPSNGASNETKEPETAGENKTGDTKTAEVKEKSQENKNKEKPEENKNKEKSEENKNKEKPEENKNKEKPEENKNKEKSEENKSKEKSKEGKSTDQTKASAKTEQAAKSEESNKTDDSKIAEQMAQQSKTAEEEKEKTAASSSKETSKSNGPSSSTEQNGDHKENGEEDSEDVGKDDDEDEVNNLQVAWEVLELAKLVLLKRGQPGWKLLADSYRLLGEVAMEGGNYQGALNDLQACLELLQKIEPREPRAIAEIHYQLALAHSLGNEFDASIEHFNKATSLLEARIKELEEMKDPPKSDDSFYTVEGEIQELKELLPEIQEKITDMKDFKQEACKLVIEGIKSKVAGGCSNGAGPSSSDASSASGTSPKTQKPASDISHLVRKKRKAEESETEIASPCKKPTPEKAV